MIFDEIKEKLARRDAVSLSAECAFKPRGNLRQFPEDASSGFDFRGDFAHDADRILHSHAFARYMDKTQVFFQVKNDHITRRALHVQMVSRIGRTIGRCLGLNEDLIEAVALGHDIGHTPFGHIGEHALSRILQAGNKGCFVHNAQSVRVLRKLEGVGRGLNLTLPVLDGILGHNGEIEAPEYHYEPENLSWDVLESNLEKCLSEPGYDVKVFPSTLEGCVVRVADIIAYVGKDFEDAVTLKIVRREELPECVAKILKASNRDIIRTLCDDVILHSYGKNFLAFSPEVFKAFRELKRFNVEHIYGCEMIRYQESLFFRTVRCLFDLCLDELKQGDRQSDIFRHLVNRLGDGYLESETPERIVADYISGMTDQYFLKRFEREFMPLSYDYNEVEFLHQVAEKVPDLGAMW